jgi:hypothetical protein
VKKIKEYECIVVLMDGTEISIDDIIQIDGKKLNLANT